MQRKYTQLRCVVVHVQLLMRILARPSESTYAYDPHTYIQQLLLGGKQGFKLILIMHKIKLKNVRFLCNYLTEWYFHQIYLDVEVANVLHYFSVQYSVRNSSGALLPPPLAFPLLILVLKRVTTDYFQHRSKVKSTMLSSSYTTQQMTTHSVPKLKVILLF